MKNLVQIDVNTKIHVKLNEKGLAIHKLVWEPLMSPYRPPETDVEGWSTFQLCTLMELFGPGLSLGSTLPFEADIMVEVEQ